MYREHRWRLLEKLSGMRAAAVVPTGVVKARNHDSDHRFRPASDFWYLTGFDEPNAVLVLCGGRSRDEEGKSVLFLDEKDREKETWTGRRLGVDAAPEALGVDLAAPIGSLAERLPDLLEGYRSVVFRSGLDASVDRAVETALVRLRRQGRDGKPDPSLLVDPAEVVHELRLRKSAQELDRMRRAAAISAEAHRRAMAEARPGMFENEIDAALEHTFRRRGSTGAAYTSIVAGGRNACILHYVENDQELADGDLLLVDAGAEWQYYASDVTRTFPVNGRFTQEQRRLYEIVLGAQKAAIDACRVGRRFDEVHAVALRALCEGMLDLGLLAGRVDDVLETKAYRRFYMHRTSHWLGLDVHDCGSYSAGEQSRALEPGMVLTVEPGLYVAEDELSVDPVWRGIGIRIEDDVHVTSGEPEVLSADVPKEIDEVESACRAEAVESLV